MKKYFIVIFLMLLGLVGTWQLRSVTLADSPLARELSISQIKITGDEFLVLHNNTAANLQLGSFWLQYFNDFNLANSGISNSSGQLPAVTLQPGQEILLTVGAAADCGQVWVAKLPFSLKDSGGLLQVMAVSQTGGVVGYKSEDQVAWSSKTTDPVDIGGVSSTASAQIYYKNASVWLATSTPPGCSASGSSSAQSQGIVTSLSQSNSSPPSIVLGASTGSSLNMPAADVGLMAPQLSELLPNPAPPQTDAADEFIELYNPNNAAFDLSGFILRTGVGTTHDYSFPVGEFILQPHEFRAFYAPQTGLTLSNDSSQAKLLDPTGNTLAQTDVYTTAKDDYAWVFANGLWQWTTTPTPDAANVITSPPPPAKKSSQAASTSKASGSSPKTTTSASTSSSGSITPNGSGISSLHPLILAGGGALALLYACYEYRHDLANTFYRFRRHRAARRSPGQSAQG